MKRLYSLLASIGFVCFFMASALAQPTQITNTNSTISLPAGVNSFILMSNIYSSSGDGILIGSSGSSATNVTLDLNGFGVYNTTHCTPAAQGNSCTGSGSRAGIRIYGSFVTIKNGQVYGWNGDGIHVVQNSTSGYGITLQNLQVHDNNANGIVVGDAYPLATQVVMDNVVADFNGAGGILAGYAVGTRISAFGNNQSGVNILSGTLDQALARNNVTTGVWNNGGSISNSVGVGNGAAGIGITGTVVNSYAAGNLWGFAGAALISNSDSEVNSSYGFNMSIDSCYTFVRTEANGSTIYGASPLNGTTPACLH